MDRNVHAAYALFRDQEYANESACLHAATLHGVAAQAEDCDAGSLGCPACPWRDKSEDEKAKGP